MRFRYINVYVSLWCMLLAAATARGAVSEGLLGFLASLLLWGSFYTIGLAFGFSNAQKENPALQQITNGVAVVGVLAFVAMLAMQGLVAALLTFILFIQGAQNFTLSRPRELYFALAISFAVILFAASESRSTGFIFCIAAYALAGVCTLTALHFEQRAQGAHGVALSAGRFRLPSGMGLLTAVILALALVLYLVTPQPPATHAGGFFAGGGHYYHRQDWQDEAGKGFDKKSPQEQKQAQGQPATDPDKSGDDTSGSGTATYSGFTSNMPIGTASGKGGLDPNAIVMYVHADRPLYLRGRTFDTFQDDSWSVSHPETEKLDVELHDVKLRDAADPTLNHTVEMAATVSDIIFAASRADELDFPGTVIARDRNGALFAPGPLEKGTVYSVAYDQQFLDGHPLGDPAAVDDDAPYLQLPDDLDPRIPALARQVAAGRSGMQAAEAIERYLRTNYQYTLATAAHQNDIPLADFLFDTRRGHCEYFATAMAVMLRTLGIPSRVATGYSAHERNPVTGYYQVRVIDGHAWVEAKIAGAGWVSFEPTAFYSLPGQETHPLTPAAGLGDYVDELARTAQQLDPRALRTEVLQVLKQALQNVKQAIESLPALLFGWLRRFGPWLLAVAIVAAGAVLFVRRYAHGLRLRLLRLQAARRIRRARHDSARALVLACYLQLERLLAALGHPRAEVTTVEEYASALAAGPLSLHAPAWRTLTEYFGRARYSDETIAPAEAEEAWVAYLALEKDLLQKP